MKIVPSHKRTVFQEAHLFELPKKGKHIVNSGLLGPAVGGGIKVDPMSAKLQSSKLQRSGV